MLNTKDKEELLEKWRSTDPETQTALLCRYLLVMCNGQGQSGWLSFLQNELKTTLSIQ